MHNPLLAQEPLPPFDRIEASDVEPGISALLAQTRGRIEQIANHEPPTFATVVEPLEVLRHSVARAWSPVSHLNAVVNSEALRAAYNACLPLLSAYETDLAQNERLYKAYGTIASHEGPTLDPVRRRVLELALRDFELAGVGLPGGTKQRFKALMLELTQLQAKFEENVLDATGAWSHHETDPAQLRGLNETIVERARQRAHEQRMAGWILTLDQPTYVAVVTNAQSAQLRRVFYEAWSTRASDRGPQAGRWDNAPIIEQILARRHEAAGILGFGNFAEYALQKRMVRSPDEVLAFLEQLARASRSAALQEFAELRDFAGHELEAWDIGYYSEQLQQQHAVSQEALRPYFPLPRVLTGLFEVAERLFGVRILERSAAPVWHPDVRYFEIESDGGPVGSFYLDPYARPHKRSGAWMDECIGRMHLAGGAALPVAHLVLNLLPPGADGPALLTHDDVLTLFHEFGHGLHHLLTRVDFPSLAGINGVAWDAVELPSQFMENYAWNRQVLQRISGHYRSGEPLPTDLQERLLATRSFQAGLHMARQLEFALFDFRVHAEYDPGRGGRVLELLHEVHRQVAVVPMPHWNRFPMSFGHIFAGGYCAGYYSYKWAEALAADVFAAFEAHGVFDRATARRYLDTILAQGGSRDPLEAFIAFRGRPPRIEALLKQHGIAAPAPVR
ncbi:MAG: M3 family metallopeptidase [Steroidobacteraceae bacterium]